MTAIAVLGLGCLLIVALVRIVRRRRRPFEVLVRLERQVSALRADVAGYRAAHQNSVESFDRRLAGLEQTTALAANELRMASDQLIAHTTVDELDRNGAGT